MAADKNCCTNFTHNYLSLFCNKKGVIPNALYWGYKYFNEY
ncbi:hypothetical protein ECDEC9D_0565 [Escherichia coli DEC9D]|nr:hypothetical protein ECDEC9D_0565 [Escherichia coli DEC9D]